MRWKLIKTREILKMTQKMIEKKCIYRNCFKKKLIYI